MYEGEERYFTDAIEFCEYLLKIDPDCVVGHNILGFDLSALQRVWNVDYGVGEVDYFNILKVQFVDTLLLSQLLYPDREGGHSLAAWGDRLGFPKGEHSDWSQFTPEMLEYSQRDVQVTKKVYETLLEEIHGY